MVRAAMPQADDDINLGFLSDGERELILEVLQRDEELRHAEEHRVRNLKNELLEVKRKGAKRGSGRYSPKSCGRCQESLSRLTLFSSQCDICKHHVCRKCRVALPGGSWLCNVCAKESDIKKRTGDWFYDQRINRFSTKPGHDLVRASLKKRPLAKKRETTAEKLLRSSESNPEPLLNANPPVPRARQRNQTTENKRHSKEGSGSVASRESFESKEEVLAKPTRDDAESAENNSISSSSRTESVSVTSEKQRMGNRSAASSPSGSSVSSLTSPLKADRVDGVSLKSNADQDVKPVSPNPETDVERLFKKSVKRAPKVSENVSTLDLRDGRDKPEAKMGTRSQSVPGLDTEEDGEEDEDIDSLVNFHKRTMASSTYSLNSSKNTLGSLMSVYSEAGDFDSVEVSGEVVFTLSYDEHTQSLLVFIEECRGLAYGDASGQHSHPYVKCYLLPDKSRQSKRKTSTKRNTVDPVYKETLRYSISRSQLFTRSLSISVWHHGRLSRNAFLGEVEIPLDTRDLDTAYTDHMALRAKSASAVTASAFAQYKGELVISLKYVTSKKPTTEKTKGKKAVGEDGGELHVFIKEAKNLMAMKPGGTSDSFVKGYLHPSKAKSTKRKTPVVKKNLNPHYDHTFVYKEVSLSQLEDMCLELTVWDREAMSSNEFLGGVRLSSGKGSVKTGKVEVELDSVGEEVSLWEKMMQYPDSWAEGTLPLRSTMLKGK